MGECENASWEKISKKIKFSLWENAKMPVGKKKSLKI
jgi:hypothetical protein